MISSMAFGTHTTLGTHTRRLSYMGNPNIYHTVLRIPWKSDQNKKTSFEVSLISILFLGVLVQNMMEKYDGPGIWGKCSCHLNPAKIHIRSYSGIFCCVTPAGLQKKGEYPEESGMCSLLRVWRIHNLFFQCTLGARHAYQQPIAFQNP